MNISLESDLFGNPIINWIYALSAAAGVSLLLLLIRTYFINRVKSAKEDREQIDGRNVFLVIFSHLNIVAIVVTGFYLGSFFLELQNNAASVFNMVILIAAALQTGMWITAIFKLYIRVRARAEMEKDAAQATTIRTLGIIGQIVIWVIIILLAADNLAGVNVTALITSLGVGGIAVGFALQNILQDIFASLTISLDKPFALGDYLDLGTHSGKVEKIGLKSTVLRAPTGERIVIGNSNLLSSRITNFGTFEERYGTLDFGIHPDTPVPVLRELPEMVGRIVRSVGNAELTRIHFKDLGNYTLDFELVFQCRELTYNEFREARQEILYRILEKFNEEGIIMPYPIQKVFLTKSD